MTQVSNQQVIVGIGASAGGLECFKELLSYLPSDTGMSFVFVQHLDPSYKSLGAEILGRHTQMEVQLAQNRMELKPNHVYVIPSNKFLSVEKGKLRLEKLAVKIEERKTVNYFFKSLAKDKKQNAVGIILSGTGNDGLEGCFALQENGGFVIAQDPTTSEFNSMPQHIIEAGLADDVLSVKEIPTRLHKYLKEREDPRFKTKKNNKETFRNILIYLKEKTNNDFSSYKKATLFRRIYRRMDMQNIQHMNEYLSYLKDNPIEVEALLKDLLIKMTAFFRNPESYQELIRNVQKFITSRSDALFRVWVPGCATGEEAYSLAIALLEEGSLNHKKLQIFATDIDEEALAYARQGIYPQKAILQIPPTILEKYFEQKGDNYYVKKNLRSKILFAAHNLVRDTPFSKLDLISCRNLFIYIEPETQKDLLRAFHFSLKEDGLLFLGNAENIGREDRLFETVSKKHRIFKRKGLISTPGGKNLTIQTALHVTNPSPVEVSIMHQRNLFEQFKQQLAEDYIPASVLINDRFDVLYFFGSLNRFLKIPQGTPNVNLLSMMRGSLPAKLKRAVQTLMEDKIQPITGHAHITQGKDHYWVEFNIFFLKKAFQENLFAISFREISVDDKKDPNKAPNFAENLAGELAGELADTKKYLQSTIESLEQSNEDTKVANEVIMSVNEELQAANEELETSKEELQSLNEELTVVNAQLQEKIDSQEKTNDDLINLIKSTDIATIFLDQDKIIKRFTPDTTKFFNFRENDVGRPLEDITMRFSDPNLTADIDDVLQKNVSREREIKTKEDEWFLRKILSYKTVEDKITGIVITFANVTSIKCAYEQLRQNERQLANILDSLPLQIAYVDKNLKYNYNNKLYANRSNKSPQELIGKPMIAEDLKIMKPYIKKVLSGEQVKFDDTSNSGRYGEVVLIPHLDEKGKSQGFFILNNVLLTNKS